VLALRTEHPAWGGRKLHHRLKALGRDKPPAPSTITRILGEHGRIDPADSDARAACQRFEHPRPNDLWQMDHKSPVALADGSTCHPLTVIDDHSRYAINLTANADQRHDTVRTRLTQLFERYGLPWTMLTDNGSPWGPAGADGCYTRLEVWLMRLDVRVTHGQPYHPQTQGKDERFHRTIQVELLQGRSFRDRQHAQDAFDPWRHMYNHERPHEAIGFATPAQRYTPSTRAMPATLPIPQYDADDHVRCVDASGLFRFQNRRCRAGKAFAGLSVALRPTTTDGVVSVHFARFKIGELNLHAVPPGRFAHVGVRRSGRCAPSATDADVTPL
jgi:transposase InsO family protein